MFLHTAAYSYIPKVEQLTSGTMTNFIPRGYWSVENNTTNGLIYGQNALKDMKNQMRWSLLYMPQERFTIVRGDDDVQIHVSNYPVVNRQMEKVIFAATTYGYAALITPLDGCDREFDWTQITADAYQGRDLDLIIPADSHLVIFDARDFQYNPELAEILGITEGEFVSLL